MIEGMREFGKRNRAETPLPVEDAKADFARERSMYERVREHNPEIAALLSRYDAITEWQENGHGVPEDVKEKERIEEEVRAAYKRQTMKQ